MESHLNIADVAKRSGLSADTLRYYERIGLIAPVPRAAGGQRRYAAADMDWLAFLLRLRETGMSIQGMQAFARLRNQGNASVGERREMLQTHLAEVALKVRALQQSMQALTLKIAHYRALEASPSQGPVPEGKKTHDQPPHSGPALRARARQAP